MPIELILLSNFVFYVLTVSVLFIYLVTMQAQKEAPPDMQCKDKFLLQSVVASPGATTKDITPEMVSIQQITLFHDSINTCDMLLKLMVYFSQLYSSIKNLVMMLKSASWELFMLLLLNHHPQFEKDLMKTHHLVHLYLRMDIQVLRNLQGWVTSGFLHIFSNKFSSFWLINFCDKHAL